MYLHFGSQVRLTGEPKWVGSGTGIIRVHSTKNDKEKRQSPKVGNRRQTDFEFYGYRLTSKILPVEERKEQKREQGFF